MNIKTAIGILAIAILILIFSVVFLFLRPVSNYKEDYPTAMETTVSQQVTVQQQEQEIKKSKNLQGDSLEKENVSCAEMEKNKVFSQNIEYEPGSLLVSFPLSISFSQATDIISEYKLFPAEGGAGTFTTSHWFRVMVEKGGEFEWICTLKADARIKYVTIDPILYLNQ